jgi:hypothetical protein
VGLIMRFDENPNNMLLWCALAFSEPEWEAISADHGTEFWQRRGHAWHKFNTRDRECYTLLESVSDWLYANVGYEFTDYWEVDRRFYSGEDLPALDVDWDESFARIPLERRNWRLSPNVRRLMFRHKDHAMLFKLAFSGIE